MQLKRVGPSPHLPVAGSLFRSVVAGGVAPAHVTGLGVPVAGRPEGRVGWRVDREDHRIRLAVWGAVGEIGAASETARQLLEVPFGESPAATLTGYHVALFGTAGAVAAAVDIDLDACTVSAASLGDVSVVVAADGKAGAVPAQPGTLGVGPPSSIARLRSHQHSWDDDIRILVHTAGLLGDDDLAERLVAAAHPVVACSTLMRDHRPPDLDVCVVAVQVGTGHHEEHHADRISGMMMS